MSGSEPLVGRCYTRARRLPLMIGRMPGGRGQLWGGPYTLSQFAVAGACLLVLWQTHVLWAHFGTVGNALVLLGVPAVAAWAARRARIEGRDPLRAAVGVARFIAAPAQGRVAGRAWKPPATRATTRTRFRVSSTDLETRDWDNDDDSDDRDTHSFDNDDPATGACEVDGGGADTTGQQTDAVGVVR